MFVLSAECSRIDYGRVLAVINESSLEAALAKIEGELSSRQDPKAKEWHVNISESTAAKLLLPDEFPYEPSFELYEVPIL